MITFELSYQQPSNNQQSFINLRRYAIYSRFSQSFRLAIIGGGIGGICTALGLVEHPHIDVQMDR